MEITWLSFILRDLGVHLHRPPTLYCDNLSALNMTINPVFHARTKHVEVNYHYVREIVALSALITSFVSSNNQLPNLSSSNNQLADIFTKPLSLSSFHSLSTKLGLMPSPWSSLRGSIEQPCMPAEHGRISLHSSQYSLNRS